MVGSGDGVTEIVGSGDKGGGFSERVGDEGGVRWPGDAEAGGVVGEGSVDEYRLGDDGSGISVGD